ncbi:uncharacterized protein LOC129598386 [Paramacrobiotus metropolitanus]|uniref:uncharacterized protein LOC129598386 n=1 Tax=Paramacrobiotus metropolitanus TaxID=2943436 RepID=UPI00244613AE|nr:uncharacterized protein LOC129598386 [Paramacrobiotus metropolitanus]
MEIKIMASVVVEKFRVCDFAMIPPTNDKMAISTELCLEVFSHLNTVAQMRLCTVCAAWNAMLEEPVVSGRITLGAYFYTGNKWRFSHFISLATLYKCLQAGTQHVTMAHFGSLDMPERNAAIDYLTMMCEMIHCLAQQRPGVRLRSLHMDTFNFELAIHSALESAAVSECVLHQADRSTVRPAVDWDLESLQNFIAVCSRLPCHTLLMTNCDVHLSCAFFFRGWRYTFAVSVGIAAARLPIDADFGCALWDALDAWLPVPDEEKVAELLELLKGDPGVEVKLKQVVCKVLCALHAADPRPSYYRGKQWCLEGLQGLQVEKLSRIARHFLVQLETLTAKTGSEAMQA